MKTHPLNVSYLVVGLVFLGLAGAWGLNEIGAIDFAQMRWLLPLTLVAAGVVGLVAVAARSLGRRDQDDPYDDSYDSEGQPR